MFCSLYGEVQRRMLEWGREEEGNKSGKEEKGE